MTGIIDRVRTWASSLFGTVGGAESPPPALDSTESETTDEPSEAVPTADAEEVVTTTESADSIEDATPEATDGFVQADILDRDADAPGRACTVCGTPVDAGEEACPLCNSTEIRAVDEAEREEGGPGATGTTLTADEEDVGGAFQFGVVDESDADTRADEGQGEVEETNEANETESSEGDEAIDEDGDVTEKDDGPVDGATDQPAVEADEADETDRERSDDPSTDEETDDAPDDEPRLDPSRVRAMRTSDDDEDAVSRLRELKRRDE